MVGRTGFRRYSKKTNFTKGYKEQEVVEILEHVRPEGTRHIKKKNAYDQKLQPEALSSRLAGHFIFVLIMETFGIGFFC